MASRTFDRPHVGMPLIAAALAGLLVLLAGCTDSTGMTVPQTSSPADPGSSPDATATPTPPPERPDRSRASRPPQSSTSVTLSFGGDVCSSRIYASSSTDP